MPRNNTATFTAAAVTLVCVSASIYASPQVLAETTDRESHAFAPLQRDTSHDDRLQSSVENQTTAADAATATSAPNDQSHSGNHTAASELDTAASAERQAPTPDSTQTAPTDESTSREISEIPQIEVEPPDDQNTPNADDDDADTDEDDQTDEVPDDVDSADSVTVIVNKHRPLPDDYVPEDLVELPEEFGNGTHQLRETAADAAQELFQAAADDDIDLRVVSAYRSYDYQQQLYDNYVTQHGTEATNEMSARPGHSEHQTGLAVDVDTPDGDHTLTTSFGDTEAGQWLAEHAHEYGFVIRYPEGAKEITGFGYEPWHLRYFGEQHAQQIVDNSGTAEEEFGLEPAPDYQD